MVVNSVFAYFCSKLRFFLHIAAALMVVVIMIMRQMRKRPRDKSNSSQQTNGAKIGRRDRAGPSQSADPPPPLPPSAFKSSLADENYIKPVLHDKLKAQ